MSKTTLEERARDFLKNEDGRLGDVYQKAKQSFTIADHEAATAGVECRKDAGVLDETPGAYKDIEAVIAAQSDLIDVLYTLKQVVCVKG